MSETDTLRELKIITKILLLSNSKSVEEELGKLVNSEERKMAWILMDGTRKVPDIINKGKVAAATMSRFLAAGVALDLIEYKKGEAPRRVLDYVPQEWLKISRVASILEPPEESAKDNKMENARGKDEQMRISKDADGEGTSVPLKGD